MTHMRASQHDLQKKPESKLLLYEVIVNYYVPLYNKV